MKPIIPTIYDASHLQAMYQELLPFGYNPLEVYKQHREYMDALKNDTTTADVNHNFKTLLNKPTFESKKGLLFVSMHVSKYFTCIPFFIKRALCTDRDLYVVMSKVSRESIPVWKQRDLDESETQLGIKYLYVEDGNIGRALLRAFKQNAIVVTFIDAVVEATKNTVKTIPVPFLTNEIEAPIGIFDVAIKAQATVVPVVAHNENNNGQALCFGDEILLHAANKVEAIKGIFNFFGKSILVNPSEWSQWGFMYDQCVQELYLSVDRPKFKTPESPIYQINDQELTFDYHNGYIEEV